MSELKANELTLVTKREILAELEREKEELLMKLNNNKIYQRLLDVEGMLKEERAAEKPAKIAYGQAVVKEFLNSGMTQHKVFNKDNKERLHASVTRNTLIFFNEERIFEVLQWILENDFWEDMVQIKTQGMVGKLENHLPAYANEHERLALQPPIIWTDHEFRARVDSGVWDFENEGNNTDG